MVDEVDLAAAMTLWMYMRSARPLRAASAAELLLDCVADRVLDTVGEAQSVGREEADTREQLEEDRRGHEDLSGGLL